MRVKRVSYEEDGAIHPPLFFNGVYAGVIEVAIVRGGEGEKTSFQEVTHKFLLVDVSLNTLDLSASHSQYYKGKNDSML